LRVYNIFIATLAIAFSVATVVMAFGKHTLDVYYTVYTITLLALSMLFMFFSPKARRALTLVSLVAFAGFIMVVALKVVEILFPR
jgi:hypothetical protein